MMNNRISVDASTDKHLATYVFYLDDANKLTDVYLSSISGKGTSGFGDFIDVKYVPEDVIKEFNIKVDALK
jgi:hypothetical protein